MGGSGWGRSGDEREQRQVMKRARVLCAVLHHAPAWMDGGGRRAQRRSFVQSSADGVERPWLGPEKQEKKHNSSLFAARRWPEETGAR